MEITNSSPSERMLSLGVLDPDAVVLAIGQACDELHAEASQAQGDYDSKGK